MNRKRKVFILLLLVLLSFSYSYAESLRSTLNVNNKTDKSTSRLNDILLKIKINTSSRKFHNNPKTIQSVIIASESGNWNIEGTIYKNIWLRNNILQKLVPSSHSVSLESNEFQKLIKALINKQRFLKKSKMYVELKNPTATNRKLPARSSRIKKLLNKKNYFAIELIVPSDLDQINYERYVRILPFNQINNNKKRKRYSRSLKTIKRALRDKNDVHKSLSYSIRKLIKHYRQ